MQIINGTEFFEKTDTKTVVTVGNFDGLHLGHRALIGRVLEIARKQPQKFRTAVMTFVPHPVKVLFPERDSRNIFSLEDRTLQIAGLGIDYLVVQPFSRELSQMEPRDFFQKLIVQDLHAEHLIVGHDFNFGRNRSGTLAVLAQLCSESGVGFEVLPPVKVEGQVVSSTEIRTAIKAGEVDRAQALLGRPFYLTGVVEKGDGRGTKIGFPTANLFTQAELLPLMGVYATRSRLRETEILSVTNVGKNPTFDVKTRRPIQVETHLLDFSGDIYGEMMTVEFHQYLRPEKRFNGVQELVEQIGRDVLEARKYWSLKR